MLHDYQHSTGCRAAIRAEAQRGPGKRRSQGMAELYFTYF